jgi:hypothetical protein
MRVMKEKIMEEFKDFQDFVADEINHGTRIDLTKPPHEIINELAEQWAFIKEDEKL